jgi:hypothetical protein
MTLKKIVAALVLGAAASGASAAVLTFDGLTDFVYGDGFPLASSMSYDGPNLAYQEAGYQVTLYAPNADAGAAHISDGTFDPQTFNWHDGMENGADTYVTLTRIGGGKFNVLGFDYYTDGSALSTDGTLQGLLADAGTWNMVLNGVTELRFTSGAFNEIDNIDAEAATAAVPLPGTVPLLLGGVAAFGLARRRRT